jgi:DNA repair exonuclease SbcCD ATPase subunit
MDEQTKCSRCYVMFTSSMMGRHRSVCRGPANVCPVCSREFPKEAIQVSVYVLSSLPVTFLLPVPS